MPNLASQLWIQPAQGAFRAGITNISDVVRARSGRATSGELDELLAEILALEHAEEGSRRALDALRDGLAPFELAGGGQPN
jgi:hypothetical protein